MPVENLRGSLLMVLAMLGFAIEDMLIKQMTSHLPIGQVLAMIGCGGAIIFSILARLRGRSLVPPRAYWWPLVLRNLGEMVAAASFVSAFTLTTLSSASAILQAVPLAVTLGAALFLGEPVGWRRWSAIGAGLVGVLLIIQPGLAGFAPASLLAAVTVAALALRDLASRALPARITGTQISVWAFASLVPAGRLMILALGSVPVLPAAPDLLRLGAAFVVGGAGYLATVGATRPGDVSLYAAGIRHGAWRAGVRRTPEAADAGGRGAGRGGGAVYHLARDRHPASRPAGEDGRPGDRDMVTVNSIAA